MTEMEGRPLARPPKCRRVCGPPRCTGFVPEGTGAGEPVVMGVDEYEVIRLIDLLGLTQEACGAQMEIARTTVTGIYDSARRKLAQALVEGRRLVIAGGHYQLCQGPDRPCTGCCPLRIHTENKGVFDMKMIGATYDNGSIFQHFGHTEQFKLYQVEEGKVVSSRVVDTNGSGHGALAGFLKEHQVDALICGGIGGGAQVALAQAGIALYAGVSGDADQAVAALLDGSLAYSRQANCDHHSHDHGEPCGDHGCGHDHGHSHGCGCHD